MADEGIIPGLTAQAEHILRLVVREEVQKGLRDVLEDEDRPPCVRVSALEKTVYGNGSSGIKGRVGTLEEQVATLVWWNRATIAAALTAVGAVVVSLIAR